MYIHTCIHIYVYTYIYIYMYIYTYTYVCVCMWLQARARCGWGGLMPCGYDEAKGAWQAWHSTKLMVQYVHVDNSMFGKVI